MIVPEKFLGLNKSWIAHGGAGLATRGIAEIAASGSIARQMAPRPRTRPKLSGKSIHERKLRLQLLIDNIDVGWRFRLRDDTRVSVGFLISQFLQRAPSDARTIELSSQENRSSV